MPRDFVAVADGLLDGSAEAPELIGSECARCGVVAFPRQRSCAACTSSDVHERRLARRGTLWTWTIQWARGSDGASRQFVGGHAELRAFIDAGDMSGWAHHVLFAGGADGVEFALGETRRDGGERIGTFLSVAQLDGAGRMVRYMVARSPAIAFEPARIDAT